MKLPLVISSTLYTVLPPLGLPKQDSYSATEVSPPSLSSSLDPPPDAMAETTNYTYPSELVTSIIQAGENPIVIYDNKVRDKTVSLGTKTMSSNVNYDDEKYFQRRVDRALTRAERGGTGLRAKRKRPLASWEKRASKVYDIPHECRKYSLFIPLHRLWLQYFSEALGDAKVPDVVLAKIIRADFHGAVLTVTKSKSPNFVGLSGIMVKETENVFNIITRSDELKALPKANNVFSFAFNGILYTLFGNAIKGRPADRIAKKFKARKSVEL